VRPHAGLIIIPHRNMDAVRTTAGELTLEEYRLALGERSWRILHTSAVVSYEDEYRFLHGDQPKMPYGVVLWPAAIALAHDLASRSLEGKRVLELGAGTGLPGIVAATLGARVVQTDRQEVALYISKLNAERNGVASAIELREADWTAWTDRDAYDLIIGSDIIYADSMHPHLRRIFETNLAPGGTVLLSDPFRRDSFAFLESLEAEGGWKVTFDKWTVGVKPPERPVGVFQLTR
jgi:methyltransferase-like protein 23